jgi:hypothetical protein
MVVVSVYYSCHFRVLFRFFFIIAIILIITIIIIIIIIITPECGPHH